jgi:hypothetical protein
MVNIIVATIIVVAIIPDTSQDMSGGTVEFCNDYFCNYYIFNHWFYESCPEFMGSP